MIHAIETARDLVPRPGGAAPGELRAGDPPVVAALLTSPGFLSALDSLARRLGKDEQAVRAEAAGYLREMSAVHDPVVAGTWERFARWMVRGYDILTDDNALAELRRLDRRHSLIFLISHRSYLDEFALPPLLVRARLDPPYGLAGANLNFFPLGTIARRIGMVHVRRATADIPVYRLALRSYVGHMVAAGVNLMWSIEGGRTRTGKLRPPRHGLLRYVSDAVASSELADPLVVPVSIIYDQLPLHEVARMAQEARGTAKQPEDLRWLIGYARGLKARLGGIHIDFGTPIPLRERLQAYRVDGVEEGQLVERVALEVCHRINRTTPVTATAAVCVAMLGADRALTLDEVCATVAPLARYLSRRGWPVAAASDLTDRSTVRRTLQDLVSSGVLTCFAGGPETVWGMGADQHLVAAVYRNSAVHVLLVRAIAELALLSLARHKGGTLRMAWEDALELRELLKFDFFFAARAEFAEELWSEVAIMAGGARPAEISPADAERWLRDAAPLVAHLVLRPFIDAYRIVAEQLVLDDDAAELDEERFLADCLDLGRQWAMQRRVASEESVSAEMFRTALKMARHRGLLEPGASPHELVTRRRALAVQLDRVLHDVQEIAVLGATSAVVPPEPRASQEITTLGMTRTVVAPEPQPSLRSVSDGIGG
ncbi:MULTISPECIES: lysophospholipid acyltransferase [unclassified Frankia]|uniref:lysophospholipid acyltransferase n=1 Tax=unclassified Frankia TaxID=2632575 RepID=UPI002024B73E